MPFSIWKHGGLDLHRQFLEVRSVFPSRDYVVNRARAHDYEQARIATLENGAHDLARFENRIRSTRRQRQPAFDLFGSRQ
jgi:hypothetical protein